MKQDNQLDVNFAAPPPQSWGNQHLGTTAGSWSILNPQKNPSWAHAIQGGASKDAKAKTFEMQHWRRNLNGWKYHARYRPSAVHNTLSGLGSCCVMSIQLNCKFKLKNWTNQQNCTWACSDSMQVKKSISIVEHDFCRPSLCCTNLHQLLPYQQAQGEWDVLCHPVVPPKPGFHLGIVCYMVDSESSPTGWYPVSHLKHTTEGLGNDLMNQIKWSKFTCWLAFYLLKIQNRTLFRRQQWWT